MSLIAQTIKNYQVDIVVNGHNILADEPESHGGDNQGPNPYDLLLASLAACKVITVHMYAERKGWPVEKVILNLSHHKIDAADCDDCESESGKVDEFLCEISFEGDLDEEQHKRLAQIADRCPIHRTLSSENKIRTTLKDG